MKKSKKKEGEVKCPQQFYQRWCYTFLNDAYLILKSHFFKA